MGITEANVKTRLSRARLQMRDASEPGLDEARGPGGQYGEAGAICWTSQDVRAVGQALGASHLIEVKGELERVALR
jgi:hypothetical protein